MSIYQKYTPSFWGVYEDNKIVGVNSGFRTDVHDYRSRGIWVDPQYRGQGIASLLFDALFVQAFEEQCTMCWSIPRQSALRAYTSVGFVQTSDFFDEGMEFGPNCYVCKML